MSAWILARAHIDVLVLAGVQFGVTWDGREGLPATRMPGPAVLAAAGAELSKQNHRSVEHRYGERTDVPGYPPPAAEVVLDAVCVVKAIDCYVYHSCEHPGWPASPAAEYCRRLRTAALSGLPLQAGHPGEQPYPAGWDDAPWGIESLEQAAACRPRPTAATGGGAP